MSNAAAVAAAKRRRGPTAQVAPPGTSNRPVNRVAGPPPTQPPSFSNSEMSDGEFANKGSVLSPLALLHLNGRRLAVLEANYKNMSAAFNLYPDPRVTQVVTNDNLQESMESVTEPLYAKIEILEEQVRKLYEIIKKMSNNSGSHETVKVESLVPQLSNMMNSLPNDGGTTTIIYAEDASLDEEPNLKINFQDKAVTPAPTGRRGGRKAAAASQVPTFPN